MLTKRQNLLETIHGGNPDRFVNAYEFCKLFPGTPFAKSNPNPHRGEHNIVNAWGVTKSWPDGTPGPFPVHNDQTIVIKDIEDWKTYVKAPNVIFPESEWEGVIAQTEEVDRNEQFVSCYIAPGLFEQCHYLMEIQNCLIAFYENPDEMKDLIKYLGEWELQYAEQLIKFLKPDMLFHHDDWGSQISTFLAPDMFEEFYLDSYKEIYKYYKNNGVELIVHHSDSYAATYVPFMIEMGIDIWQGVMKSNNIAELIEKYGGQISFMGGIDSAEIDFEGWTEEIIAEKVREACETFGKSHHYYIPASSQGLPLSTYPGVYEVMTREIDNMSKEMFK